jgi:hypothetical protein
MSNMMYSPLGRLIASDWLLFRGGMGKLRFMSMTSTKTKYSVSAIPLKMKLTPRGDRAKSLFFCYD